jgi:hypothetical protein
MTFAGNFTNNGTLTNSTGTQIYTFTGSNKTISGSGAISFETFNVNGGASVTATSAITEAATFTGTITGTFATSGAFTNSGAMSVSGKFQLNQGGSATGTAFTFGAASTLIYAGNASAQTSTNVEFPAASGPANVSINNSSGVTLHAARTLSGTLDLVDGTFATGGLLSMANGSQITKSAGNMTGTPAGAGTYNVVYSGLTKTSGSELAGAGLTNVTVDMSPSHILNLDTTRTIPNLGTLFLTNGMVSTGANTLIVNGTVTRLNGMVVGNLQRRFTGSGTRVFDVGTISNSYSPVTINATTGTFPAFFTVSATGTSMPGISGANKLSRFWTLTNTPPGVATADLTFNYPSGDVVGTAANYQFIKKTGGVVSILAPTGTPTTTSATINNVSSFSDWTLAEANAVQSGTLQFSAANYNDSETNADHTATITVTRTGGSDGAVGVSYGTSNGTATLADNDYATSTGTLSWADGDSTSQTFTVTVKGDTTYEADETVNLTLSAPTGGASLGSPNPATLTITNDDAAPGTLVVTNTSDAGGVCLPGNCSLRQAINSANSNPVDANTINFNIPNTDPGFSGGVYTISPSSALPAISASVTIDGTSQTTFGGNTNAAGPEVEINGVAVTTPPLAFVDGLVLSGGDCTVKGLIISGFDIAGFPDRGILISSNNNVVQGNYIGTDPSGTSAVPNGDGILINNSAANNTIGGTGAGQGNVISGNSFRGLVITNSATDTFVRGNFIGTNASGTAAVANANAGVELSAGANQNAIGAIAAGARNIISGNGADGVRIDGSGSFNNNVTANYIGTDVTGAIALGNPGAGVRLSGGTVSNHIGGLGGATTRNVISANGSGVIITGSGTASNHIEGNYIGMNAAGTGAIGNQEAGVDISGGATNNFVGDADASARNVISGNIGSLGTPAGVLIRDPGTNGNTVQSNYIGVAADGTTALGNTGGGAAGSQGVFIKSGAANNIIGGSDPANEANIIANNTGDGVRVYDDAAGTGSTTANAIRGNSIYGNGKLGINLFKSGELDGAVTPNDALDTDNGPNGLQNFPVITTATPGSTMVSGTLNSAAGVAFDVDIYSNLTCDGSGNGEGRTYLGSVTTGNTNGSGDVSFS